MSRAMSETVANEVKLDIAMLRAVQTADHRTCTRWHSLPYFILYPDRPSVSLR